MDDSLFHRPIDPYTIDLDMFAAPGTISIDITDAASAVPSP